MAASLSTACLLHLIQHASADAHTSPAIPTDPLHLASGWGWLANNPKNPLLHKKMSDGNCFTTIKNATFNLLPLHLSPQHKGQIDFYSVNDERNPTDPTDDYEYAFNVCGPVLQVPAGCSNDSALQSSA